MDCSASFVIGQSNYFGFGFTTLNWKLLEMEVNVSSFGGTSSGLDKSSLMHSTSFELFHPIKNQRERSRVLRKQWREQIRHVAM